MATNTTTTKQADGLKEKGYNHKVSVLVSSHEREIGELQTQSRAEATEAFEATLAQIRNLSEERSSESKAAAEIRQRAIESAIGWVDVAIRTNLQRLERRACRRREQEQQLAGDLPNPINLMWCGLALWLSPRVPCFGSTFRVVVRNIIHGFRECTCTVRWWKTTYDSQSWRA